MVSSTLHSIVSLSVSLVPVIVFLVVLIALDSYKLVRLRSVLQAIFLGSVITVVSLWISDWILQRSQMTPDTFARYDAPVIEETLKAAFVVYLIVRKRIGFMVDASIYGFAIGTGFAIIENVQYFRYIDDPNLLVWIIRGFGTAIMHGGVTAIMAIISKHLSERYSSGGLLVFLPGLGISIIIHSFYNHFIVSPVLSTVGILVFLPLLVVVVFRTSENATRQWLGIRFDTDAELLEMVNTGRVTESRVGAYLKSLQSRFPGEVVADMLCMLRLHLELSIRAKGILLMREAGFKVQPEREVEEGFRELKYLEKSIGKTGLLAASPIFNMSDHELWQLYMLGKR